MKNVLLKKSVTVVSHEEDYEGTRKSVFDGDDVMDDEKGTGVSGGRATLIKGERGDTGVSTKIGGVKTDGRKGKSGQRKSEQRAETLFYLKEAPGLKHCCAPITTSPGGQRACGEKLVDGCCIKSSHMAVKTIDKLEYPALYCRAAKHGRAGESFFWDKQSYIKESELAAAPTPVLSSWIME